ncbi:MAG: hypothetical protein KKD44_29345 [Proteobacteria bacterium]|nr:hypothetical protein [Pseudomonadota bacterium]
MKTFKGYHSGHIPFDAMQEIRQLRFSAEMNKRELKDAYSDLTINGKTQCPYCNEVFTGYWSKHRCEVHVRFDHEKENTEHTIAILSTFVSLTNQVLKSLVESSPEYTYYTSLEGEEILRRPKWFNRIFLKHYRTLAFIHANEGITLSKIYDKIPKQKERDKILLNIFDLQMRHLIHPQEIERNGNKRPLLSEID